MLDMLMFWVHQISTMWHVLLISTWVLLVLGVEDVPRRPWILHGGSDVLRAGPARRQLVQVPARRQPRRVFLRRGEEM